MSWSGKTILLSKTEGGGYAKSQGRTRQVGDTVCAKVQEMSTTLGVLGRKKDKVVDVEVTM